MCKKRTSKAKKQTQDMKALRRQKNRNKFGGGK